MSPRAQRVRAYVVTVVLAGAVLEPAFREPRDDGFPLSTYPMFSGGRKKPSASIAHVVGVTKSGRRTMIPPRLVANEEIMQAAQTVRKAVGRGRASARVLCEAIAARVGAQGGEAVADIRRLEVRTDHYDAVKFFEGDREPRRTRVHARCDVRPGDGS